MQGRVQSRNMVSNKLTGQVSDSLDQLDALLVTESGEGHRVASVLSLFSPPPSLHCIRFLAYKKTTTVPYLLK